MYFEIYPTNRSIIFVAALGIPVIETWCPVVYHFLEQYNMELTLKAQNKNCSRRHFFFFYFYLSKEIRLMFHVNPLPSRGFTKISSLIFLENNEKVLKMSSAAVVISA